MKAVDIIYSGYLDEDKKITIGGVQTYIADLLQVIVQMGGSVRIVQFGNENYVVSLSERVCVAGFRVEGKKIEDRFQDLFDKAVATREEKETITLFATDNMIPKKTTGKCMAIQHGIFWDIPRSSNKSLFRQVMGKGLAAFYTARRLKNVQALVCVDYNFLNWYRTQVDQIIDYAYVIPNYTRIAPKFNKPTETINIIFARRLYDYRGTRVFSQAVKQILETYPHVTVTIAGSGPDEAWMRQQLQGYANVSFLQYKSHESMQIHADKHIAVVPTVGSEGTSLSLLEAMSAQCAVVCTNVGGMTNIVLDGYNGLMVNAGDAEALCGAIEKLIQDQELRTCIAKNGYETVKSCFSYEKWAGSWTKVLTEMENDA